MQVWTNLRLYIRANKWGLAAIFLTWLIFFCRTLIGRDVYFLDDLKIIFYPLETVYAQFQHHWQLPQWSPLFGMGQPLLGWGQLGFFTPLHVLLRALWVPPLALLQVSIVTYFALGLLGMYVWLRSHKLSQPAAVLGAVTFAFCGFTVGHLNHVNFYTSSMLLPWLLYAIHGWLQTPHARTTASLSLIAGAIAVSGQPQIVAFTYAIASLYGLCLFFALWPVQHRGRYILVHLGWLIPAALIALALSSFAILPLKEFVPLTERADALSEAELLDFSYPPYHAITLIFPYFFGDHTVYWGAKNFQELAAYVGLLPLLLAAAALVSWKKYRSLRIWALVLITMASICALGRYSSLYSYLVAQHIIRTLSIAGRFVYLFDVGIAVLAALGLETLITAEKSATGKRAGLVIISAILVSALLYPFALYARQTPAALQQWHALANWRDPYFLIMILSGLSFAVLPWLGRWARATGWWLTTLAAITLVMIGWSYNPIVPRAQAFATSPFAPTLEQYAQATGIPARLYASEHLPVTGNKELSKKLTEPISPNFTVYQPLQVTTDPFSCLYFEVYASEDATAGQVQVALHDTLGGPIIASSIFTYEQAAEHNHQSFCFPALLGRMGDHVVVSLTSPTESGIRFAYVGADDPQQQVYFVRPKNPTPAQLEASRKPNRLAINQTNAPTIDLEQQLLERHIQVTANTSGVRWIGALSILPYRTWIEEVLANDREPFDGDGNHVLTVHRSLVDLMGITHFTQSLAKSTDIDPMVEEGYQLVQEKVEPDQTLRLYQNPQAFPRAFLMRNAIFQPVADEVRHSLEAETVDPKQVIYVDGPTPPQNLPPVTTEPTIGVAKITRYEPTRVDVDVDSAQDAWLVLTETSTPQWQTLVDDKPAPYYTADSFFRTARLTPGHHTVSFRYHSPAVQQSMWLTIIGLLAALVLLTWPILKKKQPFTSSLDF